MPHNIEPEGLIFNSGDKKPFFPGKGLNEVRVN